MKYNSILLIEDGSVDMEAIEGELRENKVFPITYRQGSMKPELVYLEQAREQGLPAIGFTTDDDYYEGEEE